MSDEKKACEARVVALWEKKIRQCGKAAKKIGARWLCSKHAVRERQQLAAKEACKE